MFPNLLNAKKIFFTHFFVLKFYLQFIADDKGYKLKKKFGKYPRIPFRFYSRLSEALEKVLLEKKVLACRSPDSMKLTGCCFR